MKFFAGNHYGYFTAIKLVVLGSVWSTIRCEFLGSAECDKKDLVSCVSPIQRLMVNDIGFINNKSELDNICPAVNESLDCVNKYISRCMLQQQRRYFRRLYADTIVVLEELCRDGPYQQEYLQHAPCIFSARPGYENCSAQYLEETKVDSAGSRSPKRVQSVCCSFKKYQHCMERAVREKCGGIAAEFTKGFLYKMANSPTKAQCGQYLTGSEMCE